MNSVTISTTELRKDIKKYFDGVSKERDTILIPRGKQDEAVVIMSIQDYNAFQKIKAEYDALKETAYLLSTDANKQRLEESIMQMNAGKNISYDPDKEF